MTFELSWGAPIHFGQRHCTPNLPPKLTWHLWDSRAFLPTIHPANKPVLGRGTSQSCPEAVRWAPQPLSELGREQAQFIPSSFNTNIRESLLQYELLCKLPSDPYILCWHKLCSQQPHCTDADLTLHHSISELLYYASFFFSKTFSPATYFFKLPNPTSLRHHLLCTNLKSEAVFL